MTKRSMANLSPRFLRKQFAWRSHGSIPGTRSRRFVLFVGPGTDASDDLRDAGFVCVVIDHEQKQILVDGGFASFAKAWQRGTAIIADIEQRRVK
jgi:hypothetical protein